MSDQCLKCNRWNRADMCEQQECSIRESWYPQYLLSKIAALTAELQDARCPALNLLPGDKEKP